MEAANRNPKHRLALAVFVLHVIGLALFVAGTFELSERTLKDLTGDEEWAATPHEVEPNRIAGLACAIGMALCAAGAVVLGRRFQALDDAGAQPAKKDFWYYYQRPLAFPGDLLCLFTLILLYFTISSFVVEHPYWPDTRILFGIGIVVVLLWSIRLGRKTG